MKEQMISKLEAINKDIHYYNVIRIRIGNEKFRKLHTEDIDKLLGVLGSLTMAYGHHFEIDEAKRKCREIAGL
jgi:hypothetical protein